MSSQDYVYVVFEQSLQLVTCVEENRGVEFHVWREQDEDPHIPHHHQNKLRIGVWKYFSTSCLKFSKIKVVSDLFFRG